MAMFARGNPARWWRGRAIGRGTAAPLGMFVSPTRRAASFGALFGLAGLIGGTWYLTNPARISALSEVLLSNVLGGKVTVASGRLSWSGTLLLQGIELRTPGRAGQPGMPVFAADQIEARFDWASLLEGRLRATQLTAAGPTLFLIEDRATGKWNYEELRKAPQTLPAGPPKESPPVALPVILLRNARVQWAELEKGRMTDTGSTLVDGRLTPVGTTLGESRPGTLYTFEVEQQSESGANGGAGSGAAGRGATVSGSWDVATHHFIAQTEGVALTDTLERSMPRPVREFWDAHQLKGALGRMKLAFDPSSGMTLTVDLDRVSLVQPVTPTTGLANGTTFPLDFRDVSGTVSVGLASQQVQVDGLRGTVAGHRFQLDGQIACIGDLRTAPFDLTVRLPGLNLQPPYAPLLMAFEPVQDSLERVEPRGAMDVRVFVSRPQGGNIAIDGLIECHDAGIRFAHFPYPLTNLEGTITFDEKLVRFNHVTALAGESAVVIDGSAGTYAKNPFIDFTVTADDAQFDERIAACLPDKFQTVWDQFAMQGHGALIARVTHEQGNPDPPKISVEVDVADGSGYMRSLPYPFTSAHGKLIFGSEETRVEHMTLRGAAGGEILLNGVVHHLRGEVADLRPELTVVAALPIEQTLLHALPLEYSDKLRGVELGGKLAFNGAYRRIGEGDAGAAEITGALSISEGRFARKENLLEISGIAGSVTLLPHGSVQVKNLAGQAFGLDVTARGTVDLDHATGALALDVAQTGFLLPQTLPAPMPAAARELWKTYAPTGHTDIHATASITVGEGTYVVKDYRVTLDPKGVALHNAAWPEPIDKLGGDVVLAPGKVTMEGMVASSGPAHATWEGRYDTDSGACLLRGEVTSDGPPGKWVTWLPHGVQSFLTDAKVGGTLHADITTLERPATGKDWTFAGSIGAKSLTIGGAVPITVDAGAIALEGSMGPVGLAANGTLASSGVNFTGKRIETLAAKLTLDPKTKKLRIEDLEGKVADGTLQGTITASFDGAGGYEANLVLADADLSRLLLPATATAEDRAKVGTGHVTASLAVQQTFGPTGERTGRGELAIKDGVLYNVPLAMGLMQVATLRLPVARSFDGASMTYYLRNDQVTFEKILLESKGINLAGAGTLSLANRGLDLTFVTESPDDWNLPIISMIITTTRKELLQVAVTGTLDNPKVAPVPLSGITSTLRNLLPLPRAQEK